MKPLLLAVVLLCALCTPSYAAKLVYLKDGSVIQARKVWRSEGRVHVLVNRDTLAEFDNSEVDIKKTFAKKASKKKTMPQTAKTKSTAVTELKPDTEQPKKNKTELKLPTMPTLPEKNPAAFTGKEEGAIRKHKREMAEKAGE